MPGGGGLVIGVPFITPPNPGIVPGWNRMRSLLLSANGTEWDLTNADMGVFLTRSELRGLGMAKFTHLRDKSPAVAGAMYRGTTYDVRNPHWNVHLFHDGSSREYVMRDRAWWDALHPEDEHTWVVEVPGVSRRYLDIRLEGDGDWAPEADPTFFGWATYPIDFQADWPFWREDAIPYDFHAVTPSQFFGGTSPGDPIISITSGRSLSTAVVTNPGDVDTAPLVRLDGPFTAASVTVGGKTVQVPFALASGKSLTLDYRPQYLTAIASDGNDRYEDLGPVAWGTIPRKSSVTIGLSITGAGSAHVEVTPYYLRAW
jgi:hypothetical protein